MHIAIYRGVSALKCSAAAPLFLFFFHAGGPLPYPTETHSLINIFSLFLQTEILSSGISYNEQPHSRKQAKNLFFCKKIKWNDHETVARFANLEYLSSYANKINVILRWLDSGAGLSRPQRWVEDGDMFPMCCKRCLRSLSGGLFPCRHSICGECFLSFQLRQIWKKNNELGM